MIREANLSDLDNIKKLEFDLAKFEKQFDDRLELKNTRTFEKYIEKDSCCVLVYEKNQKICGFLYGCDWGKRGPIGGEMGYLDLVYVIPEERRKGIASSLIKEFVNWCIDKNIDYIEVCVYADNINAVKLYELLNFKTTIQTMNYSIK